MYLSVVIPAYNEKERIENSLLKIESFLSAQNYTSEIIVVDDGSTDGTSEIPGRVLTKANYSVLVNAKNQGKGASVKRGMLHATGEFMLFTDADLSTPIEEVPRFLKSMEDDGYDVVIGSRDLNESIVEVPQNIFREFLGKCFNLLARFLSFKNIHDSQCGFKCFRKKVGKRLFREQKLTGFSFDVEIIYLAQKYNYKLLEAPVRWINSPQSRVRVLVDPLLMFLDILRIKWLHR